jgi:hypothetical protein
MARTAFSAEPPNADSKAPDARVRVRAGADQKRATHGELVSLMRTLVRGHEYKFCRWSTLRRMLALGGHRSSRTHAIAAALFVVAPDARMGRLPPKGRGPRGVFGVELIIDLAKMRAALRPRWEREVDLPEEPDLIAMEYKLGPIDPADNGAANDNGRIEGQPGIDPMRGRLDELVQRVQIRRSEATVYYGIACDYLHRQGVWPHFPGHKAIWALHCEGATRYQIARELQLNENKVQSTIDFHRARCGLVHR